MWIDMTGGMAALKAVWNDYTTGYPTETELLTRADVPDDSLAQAQNFLDRGPHQDAAILAGDVLENSLRKLCLRNGVALPRKPKVDAMTAELAKQGAYDSLVEQRLTRLADIWDKATHGQWSEFSSTDVEIMLRQVRDFVTDYSA